MKNEKYMLEEAPHLYDVHMGRLRIQWSKVLDGPIENYIKSDDWIVRNEKGEIVEDVAEETTEEIDSGDRIDALAMDVFYKHADDFSGNHIAMDYDGFKRALREVLKKENKQHGS